jgi:hypothetical protein
MLACGTARRHRESLDERTRLQRKYWVKGAQTDDPARQVGRGWLTNRHDLAL